MTTPDRLKPYGEALQRVQAALAEQIRAAVALGGDNASKVERLELLRAELHLQVDVAIDKQILVLPDPDRMIFRAPPYRREA